MHNVAVWKGIRRTRLLVLWGDLELPTVLYPRPSAEGFGDRDKALERGNGFLGRGSREADEAPCAPDWKKGNKG